jgi:hypothetical protein
MLRSSSTLLAENNPNTSQRPHRKMPKEKEPSEADIVFNRANIALAKHQRLVASWLPPPSAEELAKSKTQDELEKEEEDMFAPVPELSVNSIKYNLLISHEAD